jgi:transposase-like protein
MGEGRRNFTPKQKMEILREHLKNQVSVSELCERYGIYPNLFYRWEKQLFESAPEVFQKNKRDLSACEHAQAGGKVAGARERKFKEKIEKQHEVISWLTEENLKLKKVLGRYERRLGGV